MINKQNLIKLNDFLWEIPKDFRSDMRVPARIYASETMLEDIFGDRSLNQLVNLTTLPGIEKYSLVMPDVHEGYGSPIGGVFATRAADGIISPGAIGYDQNCGVRLLKSTLTFNQIKNQIEKIAHSIMRAVPSGLGRGHLQRLSSVELDKYLKNGVEELIRHGFATQDDLINCEANGKLSWADPAAVSDLAKKRGANQLGTLGSGNHFLEIQKVDVIYDYHAAQIFGLKKDQIAVMIHTGSRGLGHQIATDYIRKMVSIMPKYKINLPDRELACAPFKSPEGQEFWMAMACGANFAWANRQMITHFIRHSWRYEFPSDKLTLLYDVAHNIAKLEQQIITDEKTDKNRKNNVSVGQRLSPRGSALVVHRKGATRAFPPHHPEIPEKYQSIGQPVIIPGSMGTASYVLHGTAEAKDTFYSTCHGAGRTMSRGQAIRTIRGEEIVAKLRSRGIAVKCQSMRGIAEEAPQAYKNIDNVVEVVHRAGIAKKVARLVPVAVIKGE